MRHFVVISLLAFAGAVAQEPGARSPAGANFEPEVRRATAANPEEPEVRRAVPVEEPGTSEIPVRRAVAVSPIATPAAANSGTPAPQAPPRIPSDAAQQAPTGTAGSAYSNSSPATSPNTIPVRSPDEGAESSKQSSQHAPTDTVVAVAWGVVLFIALFTAIMLSICLKKGIFLFLNKWDIALSLVMRFMLIPLVGAVADSGSILPRLLFLAIALAAIGGSLFTGWKSTGGILLALLLFIPKILVIYTAIVLGILSVLFAMFAAQCLRMKEKEAKGYAAVSAGMAAGTGFGAIKIKKLIDRLTHDES